MNRMLITGLLALSLNAAFAADTSPPTDTLAAARAQVAAKNWAGAIEELKRVNDVASADWNNLMGYSLRKSKAPDLAASEKFYNEALRIDPKHRGTLEYSGELYLMKGDLAMAEARLATLDKVCTLPCAEYTGLKKSIERYKANGNKRAANSDY
jgi:Flp pilus assembly protein TadD